jgi:hypothetical protein
VKLLAASQHSRLPVPGGQAVALLPRIAEAVTLLAKAAKAMAAPKEMRDRRNIMV